MYETLTNVKTLFLFQVFPILHWGPYSSPVLIDNDDLKIFHLWRKYFPASLLTTKSFASTAHNSYLQTTESRTGRHTLHSTGDITRNWKETFHNVITTCRLQTDGEW